MNLQADKEAALFCKYLIGEPVDELSLSLYRQANLKLNLVASEKETKQLAFLLNHSYIMGVIDAALAVAKPGHIIRKKIYVAFAILESNPLHHEKFMPEKRSKLYLFVFIWNLFKSVANRILGLILLPWI